MTTRLYSHDDVGAPAHTGTALGQILTILRACLVTGYGTRTAAGWTMPFSDLPNNKAVFRGQSGLGDYFRVDDNINYEYSHVRGFATMTDVDTGTEEYPKLPDDIANFKQANRDGNTATYDPWWVVANEEFCYFLSLSTLNTRGGFFFGEYEKIDPSVNVPNYLITGANTASITSSSVGWSLYAFGGVNSFQRRNHWNDVQRNTNLKIHWNNVDTYEQPNPLTGKFYFMRCKLMDWNSPPYTLWGYMPDMVIMKGGGSEVTFSKAGDRLTVDGSEYLIMVNGLEVFGFRYDVDAG